MRKINAIFSYVNLDHPLKQKNLFLLLNSTEKLYLEYFIKPYYFTFQEDH